METKLERIADKASHEIRPKFTSLYHLLNEELLTQCHKELDGRKAVGVDGVTKEEYSQNLKENIRNLVERLKNKAYKPAPSCASTYREEMERCVRWESQCTKAKSSSWD